MQTVRIAGLATAGVAVFTVGAVLVADHSWGKYHWARTTSSFNLTIVNSTTSTWDPYVSRAIGDWSVRGVLKMDEDFTGSTDDGDRRQCRGPAGAVRICNLAYGFNGWLGIAGISVDSRGHIVSGYTKLNDSYFNTSTYNRTDWKQSVTCQELGHNIGLDHQDEDFDNGSLDSCMDYQDPPTEFPNAHDYEQLETIYGHLDSYNSYSGGSASGERLQQGEGPAGPTRSCLGDLAWPERSEGEVPPDRSRRNAPHYLRDLGRRSLTAAGWSS
jgi:hypothetical protein